MEFILQESVINFFIITLFVINIIVSLHILTVHKNLLARLISISIIWVFPVIGIIIYYASAYLILSKEKQTINS